MKCRVCGNELDPQKSYCDKCGSFVSEPEKLGGGEFSWNTIDFPKPRKLQDIEMKWDSFPGASSDNYMSADASEGFVTHKETVPAEPQPSRSYEPPQSAAQRAAGFEAPAQQYSAQYVPPAQMAWTMPNSAWSMPTQQQVVIPQPYNVTPQPMQTMAPQLSPMPQPYYMAPFPVQQGTVQMPALQPAAAADPVHTVQMPAQTMQNMAPPASPVQQAYYMPPFPVQQSAVQMPSPQPAVMPAQVQSVQTAQAVQPSAQAAPYSAQLNVSQPAAAFTAQPVRSKAQEELFINKEAAPGQNTMPSVPAAVKDPVNVDAWLDDQLQDSPAQGQQFFTFYKKNEEFQKLLDEEYRRYKNKYDTNAESLKASQIAAAAGESEMSAPPVQEPAHGAVSPLQQEAPAAPELSELPAEDRTMIYHTRPEQRLPKSAKAFSQPSENVFTEKPVTDFDKMIFEGTKDPGDLGESTLAISNAELRKEIDEVAQKVEEAYGYDKNKRIQDLQSMAEARDKFFAPDEATAPLEAESVAEVKSIFDKWDQERREAEAAEAKDKKKGGFGRFILVLLIATALFVAGDLACISLMSEGAVYEFFDNVNSKGFSLIDSIGSKFGKDKPEPAPAPELTPQQKAANELNKNIAEISFDSEVSKYSAQGEYAFKNLGAATVVDDEELIINITKTIVGFNSTWIDYVNTKTDISCFDYLKADGSAFRECSNFDTSGKTEKFLKLNIGEMRRDANFVYVFTDENIEVSAGGASKESPSRVIYKLAPVGDTYKIVETNNYS